VGAGQGTIDRAEAASGLSAEQLRRGYTLLAITTFLALIVINIPQTISPNFFRDEIGWAAPSTAT
jgi:hypothetical protein